MRNAAASKPRPSRPRPEHTLRETLDAATATLGAAGCGTPRLDAELLLAAALGRAGDRALLYREPERTLTAGEADAFTALLDRRRDREPIAHILGERPFRTITLAVDRRVLTPRPETELLVEAALDLPQGARVADVGTGSGAIALAMKTERPDLDIVAADIDPDACAVARANADRLGLDIDIVESDLLAAVPGPLDAIIANLPYVADADWVDLAPEITRHEPRRALLAGADGLDAIRALLAQVPTDLPFIALEIGAGQGPAVAELVRGAGFGAVEVRRDLADLDRMVVGRRAPGS